MLTSGRVRLCVDARILFEYREVLRRPRFDIDPVSIDVVMDYIEASAEICAPVPLPESLPDPDDDIFLEVALAAQADCLVTGNLKHFPVSRRAGVQVVSPREQIERLRQGGMEKQP